MARRIPLKALIAVFSFFALCGISSAYTGNEMLEECRTNFVVGFVFGIAGASSVYNAEGKRFVCIPEGVLAGQMRDVSCKRLVDDPNNRHLPAHIIVYEALRVAFPCKK